ncbi:LOB domain-containing protein 36-like [Trifolium pratense]|uniref:LOB domain-containing protein 36-like n=1 Tax=Trifolium pratense TaxID=57577 RepID=A0A2K3LSR4_TRIPR|nr:LOB domain-containing protein 36-like [Trifolium pratense]
MHPCAACKHLRRRCDSSCDLAPYFPPDNPQRFEVVHKMFGRCNVAKILREVDATQRENTVNSLVYQAQARLMDPVNGYLNYVHNTDNRLKEVQQEIHNVKNELIKYLSPEVIQSVIKNPNCFGFEPNNNQNPTAQLTAAQHQQLEILRQKI